MPTWRRWRGSLARNIALRNRDLPVRELNTAVQRIIDRVIFLRIAEDRGIETYGRLQGLGDGKDVYTRITQFFPQADDRFDTILQMHSKAATATRIDPNQLQREARELLELSQSLQPDMQHLEQGLLPKNTLEKLKRIENLSKHLRGELRQ